MIEHYLTYSRGWGFRPEDVAPEVQVWHGGRDPLVPIEHALQLAVSLPGAASSSTPTRATTSFDVAWRKS